MGGRWRNGGREWRRCRHGWWCAALLMLVPVAFGHRVIGYVRLRVLGLCVCAVMITVRRLMSRIVVFIQGPLPVVRPRPLSTIVARSRRGAPEGWRRRLGLLLEFGLCFRFRLRLGLRLIVRPIGRTLPLPENRWQVSAVIRRLVPLLEFDLLMLRRFLFAALHLGRIEIWLLL